MKLLQQQGQQALAAESAETPSTQVQVSVPAAPSSIVSSTADLSKMSRAERMKFMTQQLESTRQGAGKQRSRCRRAFTPR